MRTWVTSAAHVQEIGSKNRIKRLVNFEIDAQAIADEITTIDWSIHSFSVGTSHLEGMIRVADQHVQVETMLAIEFSLDVRHSALL